MASTEVLERPSMASTHGILLGPVDGFYPVNGIEDRFEPQLWVPEPLQQYEGRVLAKILRQSGVEYDRVFLLARGGLGIGSTLIYSNRYKRAHTLQSIGYDEGNNPLEEPIIVGGPDPEYLPRGENILIADELVDAGKAARSAVGWVKRYLRPSRVDVAVPYVKDRPRVLDPDYFVRVVPDLWLDFENQADEDRRTDRLEELGQQNFIGEMSWSLGRLSLKAPDLGFLLELIAKSSNAEKTNILKLTTAIHRQTTRELSPPTELLAA